jgi:hypothetical protein
MSQVGFGKTVTSNWQLALLPQASVAVQVTVVVPTGNVLPEGGLQTTVGAGPQLSVAVVVKLTTLLHSPTMMSSGQSITGGVVSTTLMV